jgi:hypothetical protein
MLHVGLKNELVASTSTSGFLAGDPDRVYPLVIPQKVQRGKAVTPCVTFETRQVVRQETYCGTSGLIKTMMELNCYAVDYDESKQLAKGVRDALIDFRGLLGGIVDVRMASLETEFDIQDFEPGLYRVTQSWTFWHVE